MSAFKKPAVALLLAAVLVCGSTVLNTHVELGEAIREVEDSFFTTGSGERSIYERLEEKLAAANGLWTVLVKYDEEAADELADERQYLIWCCESRDISGMAYANRELSTAFTRALTTLDGLALTESELEAVESYATAFSGAQKMIDESSYNSRVLEFTRGTYDKFPANILAPLAGVEEPELFY